MFDSTSIRTRFLVSVLSNGTRALVSFASGLLVARGLNPAGYGDLAFLLGSFVSIRSLLDMGAANAFYTFLSQRPHGRKTHFLYAGWLGAQFLVTFACVAVVFPDAMTSRIWLGHSREMILLAFLASFLQQQAWLMVTQIGEAKRKTARVQLMNVAIAFAHLGLVGTLLSIGRLSVPIVLWLFVGEYVLAIAWSVYFLHRPGSAGGLDTPDEGGLHALIAQYVRYCRPLVLLSWVSFAYDFADKWMLQRFGGGREQGFYQIAFQFAAVSLLATTSILNIFWKEVAEASARNDEARIATLYRKVTRGLVMFGALLSGFLIPWTGSIVITVLGSDYLAVVPVLALMFLYPIHQSMGQIGGTMFLAQEKTRTYLWVSMGFMLASLPISYLIQAPPGAPVPGLGLGAYGMAVKMVLLNIVSVNVQAWLIARNHRWKFDWLFQVVGISSMVAIGFAAHAVAAALWVVQAGEGRLALAIQMAVGGTIYLLGAGLLLWSSPWLMGMTRADLAAITQRFRDRLAARFA